MKTVFLSCLILIVLAGASFGATINVSDYGDGTCARANVVAAIAAATAGDTVQIPSGTCSADWTSVVDIDKPITLQGAGVDVTVLTTNITTGTSGNYVFRIPGVLSDNSYQTSSWGANQTTHAAGRWIVKDMTINAQYKSGHFYLFNPSSDYFQFRLTNLKLTGAYHVPAAQMMYRNTIKIAGSWEGLVDNNIITGNPYIKAMGPDDAGKYAVAWTQEPTFGTADKTIYFEKNTITSTNYNYAANDLSLCTGAVTTFTLDGLTLTSYCDTNCDCAGSQMAISANNWQRWVWRYNTIINQSSAGGYGTSMYFDHGPGGYGSSSYTHTTELSSGTTIEGVWYYIAATEANHFCVGCVVGSYFQATSSAKTIDGSNRVKVVYSGFNSGIMNTEVYGNHWQVPNMSTMRGLERTSGQGFLFNNLITTPGTANIKYRTMWPDNNLSDGSPRQWMPTCPTDAMHLYDGKNACTTGDVPQHISGSYNWNNRYSSDSTGIGTVMDTSASTEYVPPVNNVNFWYDNSCNSNTNCQQGVGCGASRPSACTVGTGFWQTDQSCSSLTSGTFGATLISPISGSFYKCTSANVWTLTYTPLQYPHPYISTPQPVLSALAPSTTQACLTDPQASTLSLTTDIAATCRYHPTETAYANMFTMSSTGGTSHSTSVSNVCGTSPVYNVVCRPPSGGDSAVGYISYSIAESPFVPPLGGSGGGGSFYGGSISNGGGIVQ